MMFCSLHKSCEGSQEMVGNNRRSTYLEMLFIQRKRQVTKRNRNKMGDTFGPDDILAHLYQHLSLYERR